MTFFSVRIPCGPLNLTIIYPPDSPLKGVRVDRAFDDDWNIIFLHLGRGIRKSTGNIEDRKKESGQMA